MTNKTSKKALFASAMSLLLCVTMLIGSTFAWFTDSASSKGNKIMAGNLDVDLLLWDGDSYEDIGDSEEPIFGSYTSDKAQNVNNDTLWEPGKTQVAYLKIKNNGNLALKYQVALNTVNPADGKNLYEVMQYQIVPDAANGENVQWNGNTALKAKLGTEIVSGDAAVEMDPGAEHDFALLVHMDENANNDYMDGKVEFDITVLATQLNAEEDSFGKDYDKDSKYGAGNDLYTDDEGNYVAVSTEGLVSAAALASEDDSITSVKYETAAGTVDVPVARDAAALDSAIASGNDVVVLTNGDFAVDNAKNTEVTIVGNGADTVLTVENEGGEGSLDYGFDGSDVIFNNVTFDTAGTNHSGYARMSATYNNCTFKGMYTLYGKSIFNDCTFNLNNNYVWTWGAPYVEFNNCTFENVDGSAKAILVHNTTETEVIVKDCTFIATKSASTWDGIPVAAVSIDPENGSPDATVRFVGTNTVSDAFYALYQVKYVDEVDDVNIYVNGEKVTVTGMK